MTSKEVEKITNDIIYNTKYQVNDRTIDLLDIQRKKYLFHLETTHDIVFDYDFSSIFFVIKNGNILIGCKRTNLYTNT